MLPKFVVPNKSPNDDRTYCATVLANGIKVLFVQDPKAQLSACSISVGIGSLANPNSSLGLAHFLEHMLFMGSAKYPAFNEYSEFISQNGGRDNAFTSDEQTNFFFDVKSDKFVEAVDRMAEFFKSAVLNPGCVEKERQAVHEEYMLWTSDDSTRRIAVLQSLGNGEYARFSIGNQETLNHSKIVEELRKFYDSYYGSRIITAVLLSDRSPEEVYQQVAPILLGIPDRKVVMPDFQQPYLPKQLGKLIHLQTIKEEYTLSFTFFVEPLKKLYKKHLEHYISHVLGYEGQNSLLGFLEMHGLAIGLGAGPSHIVHGTFINIDITLTEIGFAHYQDVYDITMKYIAQLKPDPKIYKDLQQTSKLEFEFREQSQNSKYVSKLAECMHDYPLEELLNADSLFEEFDEARLKKVLDQLNPTRLLLILSSPKPIKGGQQEKWLGANFKLDGLPVLSKKPLPKLALKPNPYLPVNTTIYEQPNFGWPRKIAPNVIFQAPTDRYPTCKGSITLVVSSTVPKIYQDLYSGWLYTMMKEKFYDAVSLGVHLDYSYDGSLIFSHYGYSNTVMRLLQFLAEDLKTLMLIREKAEGIFHMIHEDALRACGNFYLGEALAVSTEIQKQLFEGKTNTSVEQDLKLLEKLDFKLFQNVAKEVWEKSRFEWVFVGNFQEAEVLERVRTFEQLMKCKGDVELPPMGGLKIQKDVTYEVLITSDQIKTSTAVLCLQIGEDSFFNFLIALVLRLYIKEPFFDELRTKRQLAYNVQTQFKNNRGMLSLIFTVVSSTTNPREVANIMREFIATSFDNLQNIPLEDFNALKQGVGAKLTQPVQSLQVWAAEVCREVGYRLFQFNRTEPSLVTPLIEQLSLEDVLKVTRKMVKSVFEICLIARDHSEAHKKASANAPVKSLSFEQIKKTCEFSADLMNIPLSMYTQQQLDQVVAKKAKDLLPK